MSNYFIMFPNRALALNLDITAGDVHVVKTVFVRFTRIVNGDDVSIQLASNKYRNDMAALRFAIGGAIGKAGSGKVKVEIFSAGGDKKAWLEFEARVFASKGDNPVYFLDPKCCEELYKTFAGVGTLYWEATHQVKAAAEEVKETSPAKTNRK